MDFFRKLFGLPNHPSETYPPHSFEDRSIFFQDPEGPSEDQTHGNQVITPFDMFSNPLEMNRYFESQMDNLLKSFGGFFHTFEHPNIGPNFYEESSPNTREHFLKREHYESPNTSTKADSDLDGQLSLKDLDPFFRGNGNLEAHKTPKSLPSFFNKSMHMKTIRNPDGSVEFTKTERDSYGNEQTTVTRKLDDKEYTVIKKRDKEGKEEVQENLINMTEEEKSLFGKGLDPPSGGGSIFGQFFKF